MSTVALVSLGSNQKKKVLCRVCVADKGIFELRDEKNDVDPSLVAACGGIECAKAGFKCVCAGAFVETNDTAVYIACGAFKKLQPHHPACLGRALLVEASTRQSTCKLTGAPIPKGAPRLVFCSPKHNGSPDAAHFYSLHAACGLLRELWAACSDEQRDAGVAAIRGLDAALAAAPSDVERAWIRSALAGEVGEEAPATLQLKPAPLKEHYKDNYAIHSEKGSGAKAAEAAKRKRGHE